MGSSQWENGREEFKDKFHVQVLQQCVQELVQDLDVDLILDYIGSKGIIHHVKIRDIRDEKRTSDRTRMLIRYLIESDERTYHKFKECLEESQQSHLKNILEDVERKVGAKDPICIDLTKDEDLDSSVDLTCNQGVDDASVIVISSLESDDASTSWDRSSNAKKNSVSQMKSSKRPVKSSKRPVNTISSLSKGSTNWRLCVRVISKSNIFRKKKMDRGYYRITEYFSVFFRDESGQIRGVFFKDSVKNFKQFYKLLKAKKVFYVSGASVTEANPLYHRAHLELKMNSKTSIEPCRVAVDIPIIGEYCFTKINMLRYTQKDEFVDIIGVVDSIGEIETIPTEYDREQTKRELVLVDQSRMVVSVTFWGQHARAFGLRQKQIIVLIGVKVSDWKGLSLSRQASTQMHIEPDIQETRSLRKWYDDIGNGKDFTWVFR